MRINDNIIINIFLYLMYKVIDRQKGHCLGQEFVIPYPLEEQPPNVYIMWLINQITLPCILFRFIEIKFIHSHYCVIFVMKSMIICND